ncbi:MAG: hypothetical protein OEZ39_02925 [Gammaproteobacteria bacterium]|nr:hypothetical protein [Gammaproteobacteria bacterium]MDH5650809.1 hypothetical protein [Gammaproteobacteria bacterium]
MLRGFKVIVRKPAIALFSACLVILPLSSVHALGFGNIRIVSALNEPLEAEIDLLSATREDLKGLKINLASPEAFMRAGIERPGHLTQMRFEIRQRSNGNSYLKISTKQSVREPFLDFLLEMNWKNGRMLREYTVLLDPPGQMSRQPTMVASPQTTAPETVAAQESTETGSPFQGEEQKAASEQAAPVQTVDPEPTKAVVDAEPVEIEPLPNESIAAASGEETAMEGEPVPESGVVPEKELTVENQPESVAQQEEPVTEAAPETAAAGETIELEGDPADKPASIAAAEGEIDPFAGEKQPNRVPAGEENIEVEAEQTTAEAATEEPAGEEVGAAKPSVDMQEGVVTKKKDRLWKIAEAMHTDDSVTIYQVMMALVQNNPDAFVDGNVHRLKVGKVLRIEDPSLLTAMSKRQAALEYQNQTHAWEDYRTQLAGGDTPNQTVVAGETETASAGSEPGSTTPSPESELVLAAPDGDSQSAGNKTDEESNLRNEVAIAREETRQALKRAEIEGNKNTELNAELRKLETRLKDLQRSLSVRDDELASLQEKLSTVNQETEQAMREQAVNTEAERQAATTGAATEQPEVTGLSAGTALVVEDTKPMFTTPANTDAAKGDAQAKPVAPEQPDTKATKPETDTTVTPAPVTADAATNGPQVKDPVTPTSEPALPTQQSKGFLDHVLASLPFSPMMLAIIGGGVVFLLMMLLFSIRRRRNTDAFHESILTGMPEVDVTMPGEVSLETNLSGESSFLSDFAISGASSLSTQDSEVDPLTEADVFMAYGRYEAAEERILEAIRKDPQRSELRIKLLELYNTTRNRDGFERAAGEFFASIGNNPSNPQWQKVMAMGAVLAPDSPLFNESMAGGADEFSFGNDATVMRNPSRDATVIRNPAPDPTVMRPQPSDPTVIRNPGREDVMDIGLDTGAFQTDDLSYDQGQDLEFGPATPTNSDIPDLSLDLDMNMDFDLNLDGAGGNRAGEPDLSFDLGDDSAVINLDEGLEYNSPAADEKTDAIDFDLRLDDQAGSGTMEIGSTDHAGYTLDEHTLQGSDMDLPPLDLTVEMSQPPAAALEDALTMDNITAAELDATDAMELDIPSDMDEVGTKLDLAKAYIDMGDPDGARSILDEVLTEGTPPQRQEAQHLMQQI